MNVDVLEYLTDLLGHIGVVFIRVSAFVSLLPAFGEQSVPVKVKLGLALAFSVVVAPAVHPIILPSNPLDLARMILNEVVIGLAFGVGVRLFILALQTAGSIAAQATSLSQLVGGAAVEPIPAMGYILVVSALALAASLHLHVRAAELMVYTFDLFPVGHAPEGRALSQWGLLQVSQAFSLAFSLAAPFVIASLIYNLTLGVINRAMPQLMVAFVGAPVITFGGLLLLCIGAPLMLQSWHTELSSFFANPIGAAP